MFKFLINIAHAQPGGRAVSELITNPLNVRTVQQLFDNIIKYAFVFGSIAAVALTMWGAFQILTSGGDPAGYKKGLNTIKYVVIGYALLLLSGGIVSLVKIILGGTTDEPAPSRSDLRSYPPQLQPPSIFNESPIVPPKIVPLVPGRFEGDEVKSSGKELQTPFIFSEPPTSEKEGSFTVPKRF